MTPALFIPKPRGRTLYQYEGLTSILAFTMAPTRTKKTATPDETIPSEDMPQQRIVTMQSPARTPLQSPVKKPLMITESQKQALIDNLQLEGTFPIVLSRRPTNSFSVTERARKLRAQYALQAQSLRTRIELRINRIPTSLRKANMGELYQKYHEAAKDPALEPAASSTEAPKPQEARVEPQKPQPLAKPVEKKAAPRPRGLKRTRYISPCRTHQHRQTLTSVVTISITPTKRTLLNQAKSPIPRNAPKPPSQALADRSPTLQLFSHPNPPILGPCPILPSGRRYARLKNRTSPVPLRP